MTPEPPDLPPGLTLVFDATPSPDTRAALAREINDFHSRTVPHSSRRFGLRVRDEAGALLAGVIGVVSWEWLFIEALWVGDDLRGLGVGRQLMRRAEAHGLESGCHSAWLDTFQARPFYEAIGYEVFGQLDGYPAAQTRYFMRRRLTPLP
jgi:ribosomal protein S18 acetylase RimI-like enzyme